MALKKCKECGKEVSTKADKCPHCGAKVKNSIGCLGIIGILFLLGVIINMFDGNDSSKNKSTTSSTTKQTKPKTQAELRKEKIQIGFEVWDGSHRELKKIIKKAMNDPDSYDHEETVYWDKGAYLIIKTTYRGKNVFGGVVKNWVKAKVDLDGNVLEIISEGP